MKIERITAILFDDLGHFPVKSRCEYYLGALKTSVPNTFCGEPAVGIFTVSGREAHALCSEHAEKVFADMIKRGRS